MIRFYLFLSVFRQRYDNIEIKPFVLVSSDLYKSKKSFL